MGVLSDGTPYLNQRGLAALCGTTHQQIGIISAQWCELVEKARIKAIKTTLAAMGPVPSSAHIEVTHKGTVNFATLRKCV